MPWVAWGCGLIDFDNDGWADSFVANGHVDDNRAGTEYAEPPLLHQNVPLGDNPRRQPALSAGDPATSAPISPPTTSPEAWPSATWTTTATSISSSITKTDRPAVLRNDTPTNNHWIRLKLQGTTSNRDAIGAKVEVVAKSRKIRRQRKSGTSSPILARSPPAHRHRSGGSGRVGHRSLAERGRVTTLTEVPGRRNARSRRAERHGRGVFPALTIEPDRSRERGGAAAILAAKPTRRPAFWIVGIAARRGNHPGGEPVSQARFDHRRSRRPPENVRRSGPRGKARRGRGGSRSPRDAAAP